MTMRLLSRRILFPVAAAVGLGLGAVASSCGHQPPFQQVSRNAAEYGERLAQRVDNPAPATVYETPPPGWVWTAWLADFLPAVTACMAASDEPAAMATQAWPVRTGVVGVHLRAPDGRRWDCVAPSQGMAVERIDALPADTPPEGPVFARLSDDAPPPGCGPASAAVSAAGGHIGWVMPGPC